MSSTLDNVKVGQKLIEGQISSGALITLDEAAERLDVSKQAIRNFCSQKRCYRIIWGRKVYVSSVDIEKLKHRDTKRGRKGRTNS